MLPAWLSYKLPPTRNLRKQSQILSQESKELLCILSTTEIKTSHFPPVKPQKKAHLCSQPTAFADWKCHVDIKAQRGLSTRPEVGIKYGKCEQKLEQKTSSLNFPVAKLFPLEKYANIPDTSKDLIIVIAKY